MSQPIRMVQTDKARIYYHGGRVQTFDDQAEAYAVWLALPKGIRAAFRGKDDERPVYSWDYVDRMK